MAAYEDHIDMVKFLISSGANVDATEHIGDTALTLAAQQGSAVCLNELLRSGADKDHENNKGWTAKDRAKQNDHDHIVRILQNEAPEHPIIPVTEFEVFSQKPDLSAIVQDLAQLNESFGSSKKTHQISDDEIKRLAELGAPDAKGWYLKVFSLPVKDN